MYKKIATLLKSVLKPLFIFTLVVALAFSQINVDDAEARRSGGRIGGGSFGSPRSPSSGPTYKGPSRGGPRGGGFGFPFLLPFFGFGGFGGIFGILIIIAIANFLLQSFRRISDSYEEQAASNPTVTVAQVQVGLLAEARDLQDSLNSLAERTNTNTSSGRLQILQETTLSLLRHPEYWVYASASSEQTKLQQAEAKFNQFSLQERSKFTEETLYNVSGRRQNSETSTSSELTKDQAPGEYIMVTVVVGVQDKLKLPEINNSKDLEQTLRQLGSVSSDSLLAVETLWTPQAKGDTLTADDLLAEYPQLHLL